MAPYKILIGFSIFFLAAFSAQAGTIEIHEGDDFEAAVDNLDPGDTLIVHEGTYTTCGRVSVGVKGTEGSPVVIQGASGEAKPLINRSGSCQAQNTINIEGATYLTIKNLEITSRDGGDGINLNGNPSYITLENLKIHDISVGINFRSNMHHITARRNEIYNTNNTGEGMYVGCNDGSCSVTDSLIEGNWVHDTMNADQGDGIEIKKNSHSNIVKDNVIHDTHYPCILLYGTGGGGRNLVEGNVMWDCGDSGIQAAADTVIRNNIIFGRNVNGFNSQSHNGVSPNNLEFVHNTLIGGSPCLRLNGWSDKSGMVLANNAIYCESNDYAISGLSGVTVVGNVVSPSTSALPSSGFTKGGSLADDFIDAENGDVYPTSDSAVIDRGDEEYRTSFDFNGTSRENPPDAGAYRHTTDQNPGWRVGPGFKDITETDGLNEGGGGGCRSSSGLWVIWLLPLWFFSQKRRVFLKT